MSFSQDPVKNAAGEITEWLRKGSSDAEAWNNAFEALRKQLRAIAVSKMKPQDKLLIDPTAVVHEVFVMLTKDKESWVDRGEFLRHAAVKIRDFLVDEARARQAQKRGGNFDQVPLSAIAHPADKSRLPDEKAALAERVLQLHAVLPKLMVENPRSHEAVSLHMFAGLSFREIDEVNHWTSGMAFREWNRALMWLKSEMGPDDGSATN